MARRVGFDDGSKEENGHIRKIPWFIFNCFTDIFKRALQIGGRTPLSVFWVQFVILISFIICIWTIGLQNSPDEFMPVLQAMNLLFFYLLITIIIRRTHDIGENAWTSFNLFAGVFLIFQHIKLFIYPGDPGDNKFGPDFKISAQKKRVDPKRIG